MLSRPIIITCAVTGSAPTPSRNAAVPVTPAEIAASAVDAARAGASIVHIHVREPETTEPSTCLEHYRETVDRIRDSGVDVLINLTTGPGARFVHDPANPTQAQAGTTLTTPAERLAHVLALKPEICSLDIASMNRQGFTLINLPSHLEEMAAAIIAAGVKPELEAFDGGHMELMHDIIAATRPDKPYFVQFCLGIKWGMPAKPEALAYLVSQLPDDAIWSAFGIGKYSQDIVREATRLGGNVRVGFEDNIYLKKGVLAHSNAALVSQAVEIVVDAGCTVAAPETARELLGIPSYEPKTRRLSGYSSTANTTQVTAVTARPFRNVTPAPPQGDA